MPPKYDVAPLFNRAEGYASTFRNDRFKDRHRPASTYAESYEALDGPTPQSGTPELEVLDELVETASPGLHATTGPRFFGWVIGSSHPMGVAADWLTSAWGQNAGNHTVAPSAAAIETVSAKWLLDLLDLPPESSVGFVTGATMANFVCLAAARDEVLRRVGWNIQEKGSFGAPPIRVIIGDDAHTTVFSALHYLGFGRDNLMRVPTDDQGAMLADALVAEFKSRDGPTIVVTQAGQINTGAFDPHETIIPLAHRHGAWVHVDGAFGLWARACPERAHLALGIELADSWATDGHKWLQTPYDCGYAFVRDAEAHRRAMTISASYLPPVSGGERDPSHYVPELSRRARGFATWAMIKHLGHEGIAAMIERHCALARLFANLLAVHPGIAILNDVVLNQVLVRFGADRDVEAGDTLTLATIKHIQDDGTCFAGAAKWRGQWTMRLSIINAMTTGDDIRRSVDAIVRSWRKAGRN